jgi:hypothetical protein
MISKFLKPTIKLKNEEREHISIPRQGISLESTTETRAVHIRKAVGFLSEKI